MLLSISRHLQIIRQQSRFSRATLNQARLIKI